MAKKSCFSFNCPRDPNVNLRIRMPEHTMLQDTSGHYWCQQCMKRCKLMDWAKEHEWPSVRVQSRTHAGFYAILGDDEEWLSSIAFGNEDMMEGLYAGLVETND